MPLLPVVKHKSKLFLIVFLLLLIVSLFVVIAYFSQPRYSSDNVTVGGINLTGYTKLKNDTNNLFSNQKIGQDPEFIKYATELATIENKTVSTNDKYKALVSANNYLEISYSMTNQHDLYGLLQELKDFSKTNFPKLYKDKDFPKIFCLDKACAQNPQPPEVLQIVDEINASSIPAVMKPSFVQNLLNQGYINDPRDRAIGYLIVVGVLNGDGELKKAGLNTKLSNELLDYVKKTYPNEYASFNPAKK